MTYCLFTSWLIALTAVVSVQASPVIPPNISAKAWVLIDFTSGQTLAKQNSTERVNPASLAKLMTAYVVFSALKQKTIDLNQKVTVLEKAWQTSGSRMFIEPNKSVTVNELLHGLIVQSGNDAAVTLAEVIAGSEVLFAQMMNHEAKRLGMQNTNYTNATGLPDSELYTSAEDLALLTIALIRDFPEYYSFYSIKEYQYNNIKQLNRNRLLWMDPHVDGVKTGWTERAGFCLISSALRSNRRLVAVVLGAASDSLRATESLKLLNYGFQFFETLRLYQKEQAISTVEVWKGSSNTLKVGFLQDFYVTIPKGFSNKLKAQLVSQQPLVAPISKGQKVGTLKLYLENKPLAEYPVFSIEDIDIAGIFGRAWDTILLWFK